ncbi:MAG: translocation/assembly module TamB domain-containing protein, partial [Planctomycetes bacterium]|nr:translocation/assembly module TamB domain-containing protein [Planctomycetota bacterium]
PILRTPDARLRSDCDLKIVGTGPIFDVQGDVALTQGRLHRDFDLAGSLLSAMEGLASREDSGAAAPKSDASLNVPFPAGSTMRVTLATRSPIQMVSDLGRTAVELEGVLIGRGGRMYPEGTVVLNGGRIALPGSTLAWKQGVVLLPKGGGTPTIEALGTTRQVGHDVSLRIHGPINNPLLDISSTPHRADYDLYILLLTGELPQGRDWSRTTESLSVYLAKDVIRRWLGSSGGDEEGLFDRFEFNMGREVSESGLGTLEAMFRLDGDSSGRGRALWITAERDRYEDVNFGLRFVLKPR